MELNATQGTILGFLMPGPKSGWDLMQEIDGGLKRFWNVTQSHVYRELKTLSGIGLLEVGDEGSRARKLYSITTRGRAAFKTWLSSEPGQEQIRNPLLVTLWFAEHLNEPTLKGFLDARRQTHEERLGLYRALEEEGVENDPPHRPHRQSVIRYGIRYEEAMLAWLNDVSDVEENSR